MAEDSDTFIVELEVTPAEDGKHPKEWFWTDACSTINDEVHVVRIEKKEPRGD